MNREDRQQNLSRLAGSCSCVEELDEFATDFNHLYKVVRDHWKRVEEINDRKTELEITEGMGEII